MRSGDSLAILVMAAGSGERAGPGLPKQYRPLLGVPVLRRTVENLRALLPQADIRTVISAAHKDAYDALGLTEPAIAGGATRQDSVRRGLEALEASNPALVLIHDAARPFLLAATLDRLFERLAGGTFDGAAPGLPVIDTLKHCKADGTIDATVDRSSLWRVQTPQAFRFPAILQAHRSAPHDMNATDDLAIAERHGLTVAVVPGDEATFKITTSDDFRLAERHLLNRLPDIRTGTGFDVHRFTDGDHIMLCGMAVPHTHGLLGHSDADVGLHALTDAILGALGDGDIGMHFPPTDPRWKGAASEAFLRHAAALVAARGGIIAHTDVTIICEAPKIGPHRTKMVDRIAEILGTPGRVSVKATTTEGLGFTGRREGIAAQATATIRLPA